MGYALLQTADDHLAVHDHQPDPAQPVQRVAAGDGEVRVLSRGQGSHPVGHPGQLRSPDGDAGQRALRIHPAPDRHGGAQREVLDGSLRMVGADSRFDAVALEDGGGLQGLVG